MWGLPIPWWPLLSHIIANVALEGWIWSVAIFFKSINSFHRTKSFCSMMSKKPVGDIDPPSRCVHIPCPLLCLSWTKTTSHLSRFNWRGASQTNSFLGSQHNLVQRFHLCWHLDSYSRMLIMNNKCVLYWMHMICVTYPLVDLTIWRVWIQYM